MSLTNYPNGLSSFGVPVVPLPMRVPPAGRIFWVNSATGTDGARYGDAPDHPYASIKYAFTQTVAGRGDVIIVANGHSETVTAADHWPSVTSGTTVVGQGVGDNRPTVVWSTATAAQVIIDSFYTSFHNLIFDFTGIDAVAAAISVTGGNTRFEHCKFLLGDSGGQCTLGVSLGTGADDCRFTECEFIAHTAAGTTAAINVAVAVNGLVVSDCIFSGDFGTAAINNATTAITNARILRNLFYILGTGKAVVVVASATGFVAYNTTQITANIAAGGSITAAAMLKAQNYAQETAGIAASAVVDPAATAIS